MRTINSLSPQYANSMINCYIVVDKISFTNADAKVASKSNTSYILSNHSTNHVCAFNKRLSFYSQHFAPIDQTHSSNKI